MYAYVHTHAVTMLNSRILPFKTSPFNFPLPTFNAQRVHGHSSAHLLKTLCRIVARGLFYKAIWRRANKVTAIRHSGLTCSHEGWRKLI